MQSPCLTAVNLTDVVHIMQPWHQGLPPLKVNIAIVTDAVSTLSLFFLTQFSFRLRRLSDSANVQFKTKGIDKRRHLHVSRSWYEAQQP